MRVDYAMSFSLALGLFWAQRQQRKSIGLLRCGRQKSKRAAKSLVGWFGCGGNLTQILVVARKLMHSFVKVKVRAKTGNEQHCNKTQASMLINWRACAAKSALSGSDPQERRLGLIIIVIIICRGEPPDPIRTEPNRFGALVFGRINILSGPQMA